MTADTTTIRTEVWVDPGRVWNAVNTLVAASTLAHHLLVEADTEDSGAAVVRVYHRPDDVPYAMWGSGTQALWRLLCAMAYSADTVSLYEVVSHLDSSNRRAVAAAVAELCS